MGNANAPPAAADLFSEICSVIEGSKDPSPVGVFPLGNEGDHDSEFRCRAALDWLSRKQLTGKSLSAFLDELSGPALPKGRRLPSVVCNIAAMHAASCGQHADALRYAEQAFGYWQHDVFNHRLILTCKTALGASDATRDGGLADYLDGCYCQRPFEHFETTFDKRVYLCSPDYLTAPVADLKPLLGADGRAKLDPDEIDRIAWNTPAARYVRRSIIAGEFHSCSPLTCPLIQARLLPARRLDSIPLHIDGSQPQLVQRLFYDHAIYYYRSRVYAVPTGNAVAVSPIADNVLVSFTIDDLQTQIAERVAPGELPIAPISVDWFNENDLSNSVVLTLTPDCEQGRVRERMTYSPRELMMTHDNSCNISCPSCRTHTIIAGRKETEEYDRLVPVFLGLLKDAERLIVSGAGDPFASRHFRKLLRAIAGKDSETYGIIELPEKFRINLMTNGLLLNKSSYEDFGLRGRIGIISLSMDSCEKDSFERIRRGSKWEDLLAALKFLKEIRAENPDMVLISYFTVQASNFSQIPTFIAFCRDYGFQHVQLNMVRNFGAWSSKEFELENIGSPHHPRFSDFMEIMAEAETDDSFLLLGNAGDYRELAIQKKKRHPKSFLQQLLAGKIWATKIGKQALRLN